MTGLRNTGNIALNPTRSGEFRKYNGYSANYGAFAGGVVNILTKSGTNEFHGSLFFEFFRNNDLNAYPWSERTRYFTESVRRNLGGPIRKNKTFFWHLFWPSPDHQFGF
jgi:hypothetical protein